MTARISSMRRRRREHSLLLKASKILESLGASVNLTLSRRRRALRSAAWRAASLARRGGQGWPHNHADCAGLRSRPRRLLAGALACGAWRREAHVIHPSSVEVSREHRRAKTDRLNTESLKRGFI